jgi:hypothetical protein
MDHTTIGRTRLAGWLLLQGGLFLTVGWTQQAGGMTSNGGQSGEASQQADSKEHELAVTRAKETLRAAGVDPSSLTVAAAEPVTWPDSSLGCPQPGVQYLQVLTPGYRVELLGRQRNYTVHVAGTRAIVCSGKVGAGASVSRSLSPVRGIDAMTQRAREMLANAVGAPADQIHVVGFEPQVWPDTSLGCPTASASIPGRVTGFKILLEHKGRGYTFNTDLHRVIACPPIDAE